MFRLPAVSQRVAVALWRRKVDDSFHLIAVFVVLQVVVVVAETVVVAQ